MKERALNGAVIRGFAAVCIFAGVIIFQTGCGSRKVNLDKAVSVEFGGLDGQGQCTWDIDYDYLAEQCSGKGKSPIDELSFELLADEIDGTAAPLDGLSNGDTVRINLTYDKDLFKKYDVVLTGGKNLEFKVSGLTEAIEVDPFDPMVFDVESGEGIYIEYTGTSPELSVQIRNTLPPGNILSQVAYSVTSENSGHVKKGDPVEITAALPYQLTEQGYVLTSEVKEVTCQKAAAYLTSLDEIDEDTWNKIKAECDDYKTAEIDNPSDYDHYVQVTGENISFYNSTVTSDFKYVKAYFLTLKDGLSNTFSSRTHNYLYITYTVDVENAPTVVRGQQFADDACGCFVVKDLYMDADGNVIFDTGMIESETVLNRSEEELVNSRVKKQVDEYMLTETELGWSL